eukprot:SAG31_NODE_37360_length_305_cov_0.504854_1_plen_76_part_01
MEYAHKIQPFRPKSDFEVMAEVLNMPGGTPGGITQCFNITAPADAKDSFTPRFPVPAGKVYYVSVASGSDSSGDGS